MLPRLVGKSRGEEGGLSWEGSVPGEGWGHSREIHIEKGDQELAKMRPGCVSIPGCLGKPRQHQAPWASAQARGHAPEVVSCKHTLRQLLFSKKS